MADVDQTISLIKVPAAMALTGNLTALSIAWEIAPGIRSLLTSV